MKKEKSILVEEVTKAFGECFYSQPTFIQELSTQVLYITIKGEQEVVISDRAATETNKDVTFQGTADFQPFFLQTKKQSFVVIGSTFSLYDTITREPFAETKAEYEFQQQLRKALKLTGGFVYYVPGDSNDFVTVPVDLEDAVLRDLNLRYEHDDTYHYLFVLL